MVFHGEDAFLTQYTALLKQAQIAQTGSVLLSYKRYTPHADAAVRELQRSSNQTAEAKHPHSKKKGSNKSSGDATAAVTAAQLSLHPGLSVDADDEPVCLVHVKYQKRKLCTVINTSRVHEFTRSINAIQTVHNKLYEKEEVRPVKVKKQKRTAVDAVAAAAAATVTDPVANITTAAKKVKL